MALARRAGRVVHRAVVDRRPGHLVRRSVCVVRLRTHHRLQGANSIAWLWADHLHMQVSGAISIRYMKTPQLLFQKTGDYTNEWTPSNWCARGPDGRESISVL